MSTHSERSSPLGRWLGALARSGVVTATALLCLSSAAQTSTESNTLTVARATYEDRLYGFWLAQCIGNWTGLVTELDKIGDVDGFVSGPFYTRDDWGGPDQPAFWSGEVSSLSPTIDFVFEDPGGIWGADDDTDIEYMYQHLLLTEETSILSAEQLREGWLRHIREEEENYLWVSNQQAFDLMREGMLPPETGRRQNNPHFDMIDAQLTTELFGLFAPGRPDVALAMAWLPIRTVASEEAASIAEFYVFMHSLAARVQVEQPLGPQLVAMAEEARKRLTPGTYPADMYAFVKARYEQGLPWEVVRDAIYRRYQLEQAAGYDITSRGMTCNGCYAAGINFAASLLSLFWGEGDLLETIKIGALAGWDSDNPTATWAGLLGFMLGRGGVEKAFGRRFADRYNIHRTRQNFPDGGIISFETMARDGIAVVDRVVAEELGGTRTADGAAWLIPAARAFGPAPISGPPAPAAAD